MIWFLIGLLIVILCFGIIKTIVVGIFKLLAWLIAGIFQLIFGN
jgi:hypothetical protein